MRKRGLTPIAQEEVKMKSYWINSDEKNSKKFNKLEENIKTDICIIGGGLTGITTAYNLSKYKIRTVVIDKGRIGRQASGNSTAKITSQHGLIYKYLIDSKGRDFASKYYRANEEAIQNIKNIIDRENIDCDFEYQPSYVFTQSIQDVQKIKDEVNAVKSFGGKANFIEAKDININRLNSVEVVENTGEKLKINVDNIERENINLQRDLVKESMKNVLPIKAIAAIEFEKQAQFNPYKYINSLAKICNSSGVKIYENTKAVDVDTDDDDEYYTISLENGNKIKAKYLVIATKYPIVNIPGFYFIKMYQSTSYAVAMQTKERLFEGMYINSEQPTISLRTAKFGNDYLLIVVGSDHRTGASIDLENAYRYLEEIAKNLYPTGQIKYHWNTEDCITLDKIPYIGNFSKMWDNAYVATGFNKWGITTSNIAADIITDKILGEQNEYEEIFKATRLEPIKNIKEMTNMVKESVNSLVVKKLEVPQEEASQIQEGEGKIVEIDGQKIGIYKDKEGEIYKINPVCKHLGCELTWNNLDKTWDCPCHGSRYDYKGNLIYGPSVKSLD